MRPHFLENGSGMAVTLLALSSDRPLLPEIFLVLIIVRCLVDVRAIIQDWYFLASQHFTIAFTDV
jgi:hypothetical protein